jgi:peptide/nickel transport system substrate-binding protein
MPRRAKGSRRARVAASVLALAAAAVTLAGFGGSAKPAAARAAATPHRGGTLTVLESASYAGAWPVGLDPATNTSDAADEPYMDAVYGTLFEQGNGGKILPDLATGYTISPDAKTVTISLRHGVVFSDGTPFNAQAVSYNITQDLLPQYANIADPFFPVASITTPDSYTVVLHLSKPFSPIIAAFPGEAPNWIASPSAIQKLGLKQFALTPVGAGPFKVVSDNPNAELVVKRNPLYWQKGKPYLNEIDFKVVSNDSSAVDSLQSGGADVEQTFGTPSLLASVKKTLQVATIPPSAPLDLQLNTAIPPFNNILAREAIYYATDQQGISRALSYGTGIVTQSPSGPASLLYMPKVPGYRTYNLAKAKALVKQLGGLSFTFDNVGLGASALVGEALVADFRRAGMNVTIDNLNTLQAILEAFSSNKWQTIVQGAGGVNPAVGLGSLGWRYLSTGPFTGVHDPTLDAMINQATATVNVSQQKADYRKIFTYISQKAYTPLIYAGPLWNVSLKTVHGPGISTGLLAPLWEDVWKS